MTICISPNTYPVNYRGEYHYRSGSTKQLLKGQALNQFLLKKTGITWDSVSVQNISTQELRNDSFDIFRKQAVKSRRMDEPDIQVSNEQLLDNLNLINDGFLTRAAVLLFHHNPEKWIPGSYVKIAYFQSESDILYPYPKEAIREAVLNAISHKNYATLVPIQIRVYDNKIIIANDCVFPEDWTVDDLMGPHKSRPYNPLIANTFFRAGFIEAWGRGIQKIKDSCVLAGNDIPEYYVKKEDIMVLFQGLGKTPPQSPQRTPQLDEIDSKIIKVIESKPSISQRKIAALVGVSYDTVRYHMENMKKREIIVRKGNGRSGKWIVL